MNVRKRWIACFLSFCIVISVCQGIYAQEQAVTTMDFVQENGEYASGEIIVKYKTAAGMLSENTPVPQNGISNQSDMEVVETLEQDDTGVLQVLKVENEDVTSVVQELQQMPEVAYAEPNYKITVDSLGYDEDFAQQWGLSNAEGYDINVEEVWESVYGNESFIKDITVAVLDTGTDISHPDLQEHIFINTAEQTGEAGVDDDGNGLVDDTAGWNFIAQSNDVYENKTDSMGYDEDQHGTHIAGIIAAELNEDGIQGVAYEHVNILPIKFIAGHDGGYLSDALKGIRYAEDMGASIVNCSWTCTGESMALKEVMENSQMLFICSAGNDNESANQYSPACFGEELDNVITVVALGQTGERAQFSNYANYAVGAPGVDILSTLPGGLYGNMSGTSMAAPFVAGTAALIRLSNGRLKAENIKNSLLLGYDEIIIGDYYCKLDAHAAFLEKGSSSAEELKITGVPQYGGTFFVSDNLVCALHGYNQDGYVTDIKVYDPSLQQWTSYPIPSGQERVFSSYSTDYNMLYIIGGRNSTGTLEDYKNYYPPDIYRSNYTGYYKEPVSGAAFAIANESPYYSYFYICGGVTDGEYKESIWWDYDCSRPTGYMYIEMPEKRGYGCAEFIDGNLYVFGGSNETGCLDTTYKYDIEAKTWTQCANTNGYHNNGKSFVRDGKIYLFGGSTQFTADGHDNVIETTDGYSYDTMSSMVEEYDPATDTWTVLPDMDLARSGFSVVDYFGDVLIMGGWNGTFLETVEYYWGIDRPTRIKGKYTDNGTTYAIVWDGVSGATGYEVEVGGTIQSVETEYLENVTWENGQQFRIRAVKGEKKGAWSEYHTLAPIGTSLDTAAPLTWNTQTSGVLTSTQPKKWYSLRADTALDTTITLSNLPENCQYGFKLYDRYGKMIAVGTTAGENIQLDHYILTDSLYYVEVYSNSGYDPETQYTLLAGSAAISSGPGRLSNTALNIVDATVSENMYQVDSENLASQGPEITLETTDSGEVGLDSTYRVYSGSGTITASKRYVDFVTPQTIPKGAHVTAVVVPPAGKEYSVFQTDIDWSASLASSSGVEYYNNPNQISSSSFIAPATQAYHFRVNGFEGSNDPVNPFQVYVYVTTDPDAYEANQWIMDALYTNKTIPIGTKGAATDGFNASLDTYVDIDTYPIKANAGDKITVCLEFDDSSVSSSGFNVGFYSNYFISDRTQNPDGSGIDFKLNYERSDRSNPQVIKTGINTCVATWIVPQDADEQCFIAVQKKQKTPNMGSKLDYHMTVTKVSASEMQADPYESGNGYQNDFIDYGGGLGKPGEMTNGAGSGAIDNQMDVDWFAYTAVRTGNATVTMDGLADLAICQNDIVRTVTGKTAQIYMQKGKTYYFGAYVKDGTYNSGIIQNPNYTIRVADQPVFDGPVLHLDEEHCGCEEIYFTQEETYVHLDKAIPAGKIVVVAFIHSYKLPNGEFAPLTSKADENIEAISMYDENGNEVPLQGGWYEDTRMSYFKVQEPGYYKILIEFINNEEKKVEPHQAYISAYTTDYIAEEQELVKYDALEQNLGSANNYLIFNAPEHLETANQLGDNWRYLERMPVSGNANIYWEKLNKYNKTMKYGMLLHNPTDDAVNVTIHKKSAYTDADEVGSYRAPLQIWHDYYAGYMTPDLTSISPQQNQLTLAPHSSEWIYLKDIAGTSASVLFNGIINLSVQEGKTLDCYAFMMETEASRSRIEDDFNLYNRFGSNYTANYTSYVRADGGYGGIGGTANGPMLVNDNLDLSGRDWYKLLLTGNDAPFLNAGELMPLYYDGAPVPGDIGENAQNYSVIYKFNVSNFSGSRIYFQYNPLTNYNYFPYPHSGVYVAYSIVQNGVRLYTGSRVMLTSTYPDFDGDFDVDIEEAKIDLTQPFSIEIIVSGMSSMPLTVIFE